MGTAKDRRVQKALWLFLAIAIMVAGGQAFAVEVSLAWDASTSEDIAGYKVHFGTAHGSYDRSTAVGNQLTHTVASLDTETGYCFAVTALDATGNESAYSNEVCTGSLDRTDPDVPDTPGGDTPGQDEPPTPDTPPGSTNPPTDPPGSTGPGTGTGGQSSTTEVALAWDASASEGITGYKVYFGTAHGSYDRSTVVGNQLTYTVAGLDAGIGYCFTVTALDTNGNESAYSNEVCTGSLDRTDPDVPDAPGGTPGQDEPPVPPTPPNVVNPPTAPSVTPGTTESEPGTDGAFEFTLPLFASSRHTLGGSVMVGLGLLNQGMNAATVHLNALNDEGHLIEGDGITNPVMWTLPLQTQINLLDFQVLGDGWANAQTDGWMHLRTNSGDVGSLLLVFDDEQSFIESAKPIDVPLHDFIFTDIERDGYNALSLVNSNSEVAEVTVDLVKADGSIRNSVKLPINPKGMVIADLYADLFTEMVPEATDYVRVHATQEIRPFDFLHRDYGDLAILEGQDASARAGATMLYAPNYVHDDSARTSVSVINLSPLAGMVSLRLISDDGTLLGVQRQVTIPAGGKLYIEDPAFFLAHEPRGAISGYVEIISDGPRLSGSVLYGDSSRQAAYTAMPLAADLGTSTLFNYVASSDIYSSRIAIVNPGKTPATVTASLHATDGTMLESTQFVVLAQRRLTNGVETYFPTLVGANQTGGYVRIASSSPTASYMELGMSTALAVIPSQPSKQPPTVAGVGQHDNGDSVPDGNDGKNDKDKIKQNGKSIAAAFFDAVMQYFTGRK